jgi:hypothetical protein
MQSLPLQDLAPRPLVDSVVDLDNKTHVLLLWRPTLEQLVESILPAYGFETNRTLRFMAL